ncbi:nicotinate-nucleotide adenylyltransferase [Pseudodesulfovibrio sp.]|nr:nicotinate-nucleotide adenylyltransferase [Pseudodesulfovibrio sp.]
MTHPVGFIHGRFQVVHNDHLKYLLAGKALCEHLIVGVTNPTPTMTAEEVTDPHRSCHEHNPLTFDERRLLIRFALLEAGIESETFSIVPFPISRPDVLENFAPRDATYYLTIYDDWGREKKQRLESFGLKTHVMWEKPVEEKGITGTDVRHAIKEDDNWRSLVPPAVAEKIVEWKLQERFIESSESTSGS